MKFRLLTLAFFTTIYANAETKDVFKKATTNAIEKSALITTTPTVKKDLIVPAKKRKLSIAQATILAINSVRSQNQICAKATTPLKWSQELYNVAKEHSIDMATSGLLSHEGSGTQYDFTAKKLGLKRGSHFYERINQERDSKQYLSGELIVRTDKNNFYSPKDVINYWIKIDKDCKIIMDPRFSEVALSKVISKKDNKAYWTLNLRGKKSEK